MKIFEPRREHYERKLGREFTDEECIRRHWVCGTEEELLAFREITDLGADPVKTFWWLSK